MPHATLGLVLAGGQGSRLFPLTKRRAKPAVPIWKYRIIDFVLANFFNSGVRHVIVVTQYAPISLSEHIQGCWLPMMGFGDSLVVAPPQMRSEADSRYIGTANAVWQNRELIANKRYEADVMAIFGGDHIYAMDISHVVRYHKEKRSAFTICVDVVPVEVAAGALGVLQVDTSNRVLAFVEKPPLGEVPEIPGRKGFCYASMGNYIADTSVLWDALERDASIEGSSHDFGKEVIPMLHAGGVRLYAYPFHLNEIKGQVGHYWRDVGTLRAYYETALGMLVHVPPLNLENPHWMIPSRPDYLPGARILGSNAHVEHVGMVGGVVIDNAHVAWSMLGRSVMVREGVHLSHSVIFDDVRLGERAKLQRVICDKHVDIPPDLRIGFDRVEDERLGLHVEDLGDGNWITVVPEHHKF